MQRHLSRALDCAASSARTVLGKRRCRGAVRSVIEPLEIRRMLSVSFAPQYGIQATSNNGTVRTGNVPVYLIFAGGSSSGFGYDHSLTESQIVTAVDNVLASPFLTGLSEYGANCSGFQDGTYVSNYNLTNGFSTTNLLSCVGDALNDGNGTLNEVDDTNNDGIYFVFTPTSINSNQSGAIGYHTWGSTGSLFDPDNASFGWVSSARVYDTNRGIYLDAIDSISSIFSHELAETMSDPQTSSSPGVTTVPTAAFQAAFATSFYQNPGEVCDNEAQLYIGYEGDVAVQSVWSQAQNLFVIPGGTNQSFPLHGTSLVINGDQLGPTPYDDNLTISDNGGGIEVKLNSDTVDYGPGDVTNIQVNLLGGNNNVAIDSLPAGVTVNIDGAGGLTSLTGNTSPNVWHVTGVGSGDLNGAVHFTNLVTLIGGLGADNFDFSGSGSVEKIDGAGGANTLDYSGQSGPVTLDLSLNDGSNIGSFANIQNFVGSASSNDSLIGPDASWIIDGANSGTVNGIPFSSFEDLIGSGPNNSFAFVTGGSISGNLDGGVGETTLDYSGFSGPVTVNLANDTATEIGGNFFDVQTIVGSSASDTLVGPNAAAIWTLTGSNSGKVNGTAFSSFENLTGGTGNDAFVFMAGGSVDGNIDGGGGSNTLDYSNLTTNVTINIGAHTATGIGGTWSNINTFIGSQGTNTLAGSNAGTTYTITGHNVIQVMGLTFGGFQSIVGGSGNDTFAFQTGGSLDGSIDGGGGTTTLTYAAYTGNVIVNLQLHTATGVGGTITNIQNVVAGNGNDMIVGDANPNVLTGGTGRSILIGGGVSDVLNGGLSDNILIGDGTIYDLNAVALMAIFNEWTRTDASFQQRVAHLISPGVTGLNGVYTLDKSAIIQDNAADTINGSASTVYWFFDDKKLDTVTGVSPQDHTTGV